MNRRPEYLLKVDNCADIQAALQLASSKKFSGIISKIVSDEFKAAPLDDDKPQCFTRSPLVFSAWQWQEKVYPTIKLSSRLGSSREYIRLHAERKVMQELMFAVFLRGAGIICIDPTDCEAETLGKFLLHILSKKVFKEIKFVIEMNLFDGSNCSKMYRQDLTDEEREAETDSWAFWNEMHMNCNYSSQLEVALIINPNLPSNDTAIYRWIGETIAMLIIPHNTYTTNKAHYPIMSKRHQTVVRKFIQYTHCRIAIEPKSLLDHRIEYYLDYIMHQSTFINYNDHYNEQDCPRFPLQPLYNNLDNNTYEVFERDPAKYILYQRAIEAALNDLVPDEEVETRTVLLMIVGCGRGPLIRSALNASANTKRKIKILAVEKNPSAIVLLTCMIRDLWLDKDITLISKDMRQMELEEKADILVSELMGSFGDNELSPECLDGVQHLLKPTGVSIPQNSKSYVQPIMNKQVYRQIQKKIDDTGSVRTEYSEPTEVNWLSYMSNVFHIDETKELFTFVHPNRETPIDNSRHAKLMFQAPVDCILHGFAGYFTSQLYKDIEISILPSTHTKGMGSWYSMFFPVSKAIQLKESDKIEVEFWRKVDPKKVWYEWRVNEPEISICHNINGEIHPIFL